MNNFTLTITTSDGDITLTQGVSFTFEKERYTGYTKFSGTFIGSCEPSDILYISFYYQTKLLHCGFADKVSCRQTSGKNTVTISSYGFTMLLGQNLSEPGILSSPNLDTLLDTDLDFYGITHQSSTSAVNYLYINDNTTIWDSICNYTLKAYDSFPVVIGANKVVCKASGNTAYGYDTEKIVYTESGVHLTNLISKAYTNDSDGDWSYELENSYAAERNIIKQKYYQQDKEFLYNLNVQLEQKIQYADKGREYAKYKYVGYKGEDLLDTVTLSNGNINLSSAEVDYIKIDGSKKGIFTTISCYFDSYCN